MDEYPGNVYVMQMFVSVTRELANRSTVLHRNDQTGWNVTVMMCLDLTRLLDGIIDITLT